MRAWVYAYSTGALAREVTRIHQNIFDLGPFRGIGVYLYMDGLSSIKLMAYIYLIKTGFLKKLLV